MDELIIDTPGIQISELDFLIRLLVATGIGFLIGFEREHSAMIQKEPRFAGVRTFISLVLLGFSGAMLNFLFSPWVFIAILLAVITFIGISYWSTSSKGDIGGTTEFTALLAFVLGSLTFLGYYEISLIITVLVLVMLSSKLRLHSMIGKITPEEMYDFIRFVVVALLVFPFLPDENYGPDNMINPREIGWIMLLYAGIKFIGYLLMKFLDAKKGIVVTGLIGGLFSSTLVTWVFSRKSKESPTHSASCATAIMAASAILILRVMFWLFLFNKILAGYIAIPMLAILIVALLATIYLYYKSPEQSQPEAELPKGKPLDLQGALLFGILYSLFVIFVSYTKHWFGDSGILVSGAIAGLTDLDAITITVSKLSVSTIPMVVAANAILIATISNTLVKIALAIWAGSRELKKFVILGYGLVFLVGFVSLLIMNL